MKLEVGHALEAGRLVVKPQMKNPSSLLEVQQARRLAGTIRRPGNPWPMTGPRKKERGRSRCPTCDRLEAFPKSLIIPLMRHLAPLRH